MNRSAVFVYAGILALGLLVGCGEDTSEAENPQVSNSSEEQVHPTPERLPHADAAPISVSEAEACDLTSVPASLERLQAHINGDDAMARANRIPVNVPENSMVELASLNEDLVLILVTRPGMEALWSYHIPTDNVSQVARRGQGPGEVMFPNDLAVQGSKAYVSMGTRRIATFACDSASCTHRKDVRTQFQPTQIEASGDRFATTGMLPLRGETEIDTLRGTIHHVDMAGTLTGSFGESYQTNAWLVKEWFAKNKGLAALLDGSYAVHYNIIPRLYTYDSNQTLRHIIEIDDFLQPTFVYGDGRRSTLRAANYSRISQLSALVGDLAFLSVSTVQRGASLETIEEGDEIQIAYDYYLMGGTSGCVSHLGRQNVAAEYGGGDRVQWVPTEHHLLRIGGGSVHLIKQETAVQEG